MPNEPRKHILWLYDQLPGLEKAGAIDAETAERLRTHYGPAEAPNRAALALVICGLAGAVLIGLGIILMVAHNWAELGRGARCALSVAPLVLAQIVSAWVLKRRGGSAAWTEPAAVFQALLVGAAIALVSQTYQIQGDLARFILTWALLGAPLVYLLDSTAVAALYSIAVMFWTFEIEHDHALPLWLFWPLIGVVIPHYVVLLRRDGRHGLRPVLLGWAMAVAGLSAGWRGLVGRDSGDMVEVCTLAALAGLMMLAGARWLAGAPGPFRNPWRSAATVTAFGIALVLSFRGGRHWDPGEWKEWVPAVPVIAAALAMLVWAAVERRWAEAVPALILPVVALLQVIDLAFADPARLVSPLLANGFLIAWGVAWVASGVRRLRMGVLNAGLAVISIVTVMRFFDSDIPFVLRGCAFILIGAGFLYANFKLASRRKEAVQ